MKEVPVHAPPRDVVELIAQSAQAASSGTVGKATFGGAFSAMGLGALTASEIGMLIGAAVAVGSLGLQVVLGLRDDRRKQREHEARMASGFGVHAHGEGHQ